MNQRNHGLDLLRAIAILSTILFHANLTVVGIPDWLFEIGRHGWMGVNLFFVLSGFLIGAHALAQAPSPESGEPRFPWLAKFWVRRWTRTVPLYVFVLGLYLVLKPLAFHTRFDGFSWKYFFFLQNLDRIGDYGQSWSLCIEEQFYFVFPLALLVLRPKRPALWLAPLLLSVACRFGYWITNAFPFFTLADLKGEDFDFFVRFPTWMHLDGISAGLFLAATRERWQGFDASIRRRIGAIGVTALLLTAIFSSHAPADFAMVWQSAALALSFSCIVVGAYGLGAIPLATPVIHQIALLSYGAYLWGGFPEKIFHSHPLPMAWPISLTLYAAASFALAWGTFKAVEKPGMALRGRLEAMIDAKWGSSLVVVAEPAPAFSSEETRELGLDSALPARAAAG